MCDDGMHERVLQQPTKTSGSLWLLALPLRLNSMRIEQARSWQGESGADMGETLVTETIMECWHSMDLAFGQRKSAYLQCSKMVSTPSRLLSTQSCEVVYLLLQMLPVLSVSDLHLIPASITQRHRSISAATQFVEDKIHPDLPDHYCVATH